MTKWISVKERLPDYDDDFIVYNTKTHDMNILQYAHETWFDLEGDRININFTHWMELPDPPKENEMIVPEQKFRIGEYVRQKNPGRIVQIVGVELSGVENCFLLYETIDIGGFHDFCDEEELESV